MGNYALRTQDLRFIDNELMCFISPEDLTNPSLLSAKRQRGVAELTIASISLIENKDE